ncbi:hypothetical protein C5Y85_24230 [Escherichia coli]|nr:hypothetical protein C5Y85_24230 [Escherichia coli]
MGSCAAPSAKGDDKFITTDYLQQCQIYFSREARELDDDLLKWHGNEIETTRMQVPVNIENLRIRWQKFKAKDRQRK